MRGAPASSVAKIPGWPSVEILVTAPKPASRSMFMVSSQPSFMPRFSAAMEGWRIQVCRRLTLSSWRLVISAVMASRSPAAAAREVCGQLNAAAPAAAARDEVRRNSRRSTEVACASAGWLVRFLSFESVTGISWIGGDRTVAQTRSRQPFLHQSQFGGNTFGLRAARLDFRVEEDQISIFGIAINFRAFRVQTD